MSTIQSLEQVLERKQAIRQGETAWAAKQQSGGKLTARARVEALLDPASFVELDCLVARDGLAEGVVTGYGTVDGRPVYVFSQDYTVKAGAVTSAHAAKIVKVLELARKCGAPVVGICDSAGARLEEGAAAMNAYADIFAHVARLSGVVPTIGLVLGPCVGAAAILPILMDITLSVPGLGQLMAVGPAVASEELGQSVDAEALGGAQAQAKHGGIHLLCSDEKMAFAKVRMLLGLLPDNNLEDAPLESADDLNRKLNVTNPAETFSVVEGLLDAGSALPLSEAYAPNLLTVLGRMGGRSVGIVANHALESDGKLDAAACRKAARFVRLCDCFNLPVISLIHTKGLAATAPAGQAELLKAVGQLTYAYAEATCTKLSVVIGSAIGAGYVSMGGKAVADVTYAWPGAVISALLPEAAVALYEKDAIAKSQGDAQKARQALADKYAAEVADGVNAAMQGLVDDVIDPADTRRWIMRGLLSIPQPAQRTGKKRNCIDTW